MIELIQENPGLSLVMGVTLLAIGIVNIVVEISRKNEKQEKE